ncbi:MAG: cupin domain-containing protein [Clostridium sp.]|nr:cupin domain-containing protein [Clostridium sp.]
MINIVWNGIHFSITDIGGGKLGEDIPRHAHAKGSYELHFITDGQGELVTDDRTYKLTKGNFFITGENIYHKQTSDKSNPVEDVFLMLQANSINKANAIGSVFLSNIFCFIENFDNTIAKEILYEYRAKMPDYNTAIEGLTTKLLTDITRAVLPQGFIEKIKNENLNDRRFVLIEQAFLYTPNLTLSQLASTIGLCERQTQRLLKKYYGKSFREKKLELKQ